MAIIEQNIPLTHAALSTDFRQYARPNDKISYYIEKGKLISLTKGKYVTPKAINENKYLMHQAANIIYGPSYISRYSALSFYGLLAETTTEIESLTPKRSKLFSNQLGRFRFYSQPIASVFSIGVESKKINSECAILIATPEKAICDIIWTTPHLILNKVDDVLYFLEEDLRIDIDMLSNANLLHIEKCIELGKKKKKIQLFLTLLKKIR